MISGRNLWPNEMTNDLVHRNVGNRKIETYPDLPNNLFDVLEHSATLYPDKIAIVDNDDQEYSYRELKEMTNHLPPAFITNIRLQTGSM